MSTVLIDLLVASISLAIGVAVLLLVPSQISGETVAAIRDMQSPAFFPILAACLMVLCSLILGIRSARSLRGPVEARIQVEQPRAVLAVTGVFVLFAVGTYYFGLLVACTVTILVMGYFLNYRQPMVLVPFSIGMPICIYVLFERTLRIILPEGVLF